MVREKQRRSCSWLLALTVSLGVVGCATGDMGQGVGAYPPGMERQGRDLRQDRAPAAGVQEGAVGSGFFGLLGEKRDSFQVLQDAAGLREEKRHEAQEELETRDVLNSALDGAGDALEEMVVGLATLITDPIRGAEGLAQLPSAVAALIRSSPDYFARYSTRPLREQIREAARLSTHLIMLYGSVSGTSTRVTTAGANVPVLSLTAGGAVAVEQVAVPAGSTAVAVGVGAGSVYVVMAGEEIPEKGDASPAQKEPGEWTRKKFAGSDSSRRYQEQITGRWSEFSAGISMMRPSGVLNSITRHLFPDE